MRQASLRRNQDALDLSNWVSREALPSSCSDTAIACALIYSDSSNLDHIGIVDVYFSEDADFGTGLANCLLGFYDVQELAAHEFGHASGRLAHSPHVTSVMFRHALPGCTRIPTAHDINSMNKQLAGSH